MSSIYSISKASITLYKYSLIKNAVLHTWKMLYLKYVSNFNYLTTEYFLKCFFAVFLSNVKESEGYNYKGKEGYKMIKPDVFWKQCFLYYLGVKKAICWLSAV
jgi:hypothetical protein